MNGHHENQLKNMLLSTKISCQDVLEGFSLMQSVWWSSKVVGRMGAI